MTDKVRNRLKSHPAGAKATACFDCGICVAGCPVGYLASDYNLVQNLYNAYHYDVLDPSLWWCATCYTCQDRCPYDVAMVEIIFLLQQLYVERHGLPEHIGVLVTMVEQSGYMGDITEALNNKRERMGLPPLSTDVGDEVQRLLQASRSNGGVESEGENE